MGGCFGAAFPEKKEPVLVLARKGLQGDLMGTKGTSIMCKAHSKLGKSQRLPIRKYGGGRKRV